MGAPRGVPDYDGGGDKGWYPDGCPENYITFFEILIFDIFTKNLGQKRRDVIYYEFAISRACFIQIKFKAIGAYHPY